MIRWKKYAKSLHERAISSLWQKILSNESYRFLKQKLCFLIKDFACLYFSSDPLVCFDGGTKGISCLKTHSVKFLTVE